MMQVQEINGLIDGVMDRYNDGWSRYEKWMNAVQKNKWVNKQIDGCMDS